MPDLARQLRWMGALPLSYQSSLLRKDILESTQPVHSELDLIPHIDQNEIDRFANGTARDIADRIMRLDQQTYLADDLLVKSDRSTMAASLEARLPFLAFPLVEFAQRCLFSTR
ncbi:MAG: asparagine synthase-related protein [Cyanobacteriota/Melainabacteria group bacterium]